MNDLKSIAESILADLFNRKAPGNHLTYHDLREMAVEFGEFSPERLRAIADWLEAQGYVKTSLSSNTIQIAITAKGKNHAASQVTGLLPKTALFGGDELSSGASRILDEDSPAVPNILELFSRMAQALHQDTTTPESRRNDALRDIECLKLQLSKEHPHNQVIGILANALESYPVLIPFLHKLKHFI